MRLHLAILFIIFFVCPLSPAEEVVWGVYKIRKYGWKRQKPDAEDRFLPIAISRTTLPTSYDMRSYFPPCYDQGSLGTCTANALGAAWQYALISEGKRAPTPARLFLYYYARLIEGTVEEDSGANLRDIAKVLSRYGCCSERLVPYRPDSFNKNPSRLSIKTATAHTATNYLAVGQNETEIKTCLASGFPVAFGFLAYKSFGSADTSKTGIVAMPEQGEEFLGGHAMLIVGYDDSTRTYICRNSWGTSWGQSGYCEMPYDYVNSPLFCADFWIIKSVN